jgi:adenylate cyclase
LRGHQDAVLPLVASHGARIVDSTGDGILAEFERAVRAVDCAVAIQTMRDRNWDEPERDRMRFRIGVNIRRLSDG